MSYHSWTNKPPTKEYQDAHPGEFTKWAEKYCGTCGRLPAFCECHEIRPEPGVLSEIMQREREHAQETYDHTWSLYHGGGERG